MPITIFGKQLFGKANKGDAIFGNARNEIKDSKYIPDFFNQRSFFGDGEGISMEMSIQQVVNEQISKINQRGKKVKPDANLVKPPAPPKKMTPKEVYELKMLNDPSFKINTDPKYVQDQIDLFKTKLSLIRASDWDMEAGTKEVASILMRMENRLKYPQTHSYFDEFPYTSTDKIQALIKEHTYLKIGNVDQFVADLPKVAIDTMSAYKKKCIELCDKYPVFYIIADKEDFRKTEKRRDPILLAQSPFGHFWQVLGAWDKEMMLLEEL